MHLAAAGLDVRHPVDIVAEAAGPDVTATRTWPDGSEHRQELDELSFELLHEAVAERRDQAPDADKTLTQARRAVEKAAALLDTLATDPDPEEP